MTAKQQKPPLHGNGMTMTDFLTLSALGKEIIVVNGLDAVTVQLKAIRDYCQGIYDNQGDMLCRVINDQHKRISQTVNDKIDKSQDSLKWQLQEGFQKQTERLRHRDMLPWKLKVKWTAVGLLSSTVFYTLLSLLKIL